MNQRTTSDIAIKRLVQGVAETVVTVPITPACRRKFSLMQEDSITLSFALSEAVHICIGDYIEDELFGKFVATKEQMPKYNTATGGYDYSLVLDAEYMVWRNIIFCLVATPFGESDAQRMESNWQLTDTLGNHVGLITANLSVLGAEGWVYDISTAENASERKYIAYKGISILEALDAMADTYGCEWWVTMENKTIHLGKCEGTNTPIEFSLGENVESMDIADNRNNYANRLYVFGGRQNIPVDYDRQLIFTPTEVGSSSGKYHDAVRPISVTMVGDFDRGDMHFGAFTFGLPIRIEDPERPGNYIYKRVSSASTNNIPLTGGGTIAGTLEIAYSVTRNTNIDISVDLMKYGHVTAVAELYSDTVYTTFCTIPLEVSQEVENYTGIDDDTFYIKVTMTLTSTDDRPPQNNEDECSVAATLVGTSNSVELPATLMLVGDDTVYNITFSNEDGDRNKDMLFTFDDGAPSGWGETSRYTLGGLSPDIPLSYYTDNYEAGVLTTIGERRLHLPLDDYPHRYCDTSDVPASAAIGQVVESVVVFDDIYPKVELVITDVRTVVVRDEITHEDGTKTYENGQVYYFKVELSSGNAFNFDAKMLLDGERLQGNFYAIASASQDNMLAGMTFELGYNKGEREFFCVRNEDYGVLLPNNVLRPSVGDTLTITGWNPRFMDELGLVDEAEQALADKAEDYADALEEGQFTFTCRMMSDWPFSMGDDAQLYTSDDEPVEEQGGSWFYVQNGYSNYQLPIAGAKVTINHPALKGETVEVDGEEVVVHQKTSRVIGYEFKLDAPWDSPIYTIGETDAYSRLKQIEKELHKLS